VFGAQRGEARARAPGRRGARGAVEHRMALVDRHRDDPRDRNPYRERGPARQSLRREHPGAPRSVKRRSTRRRSLVVRGR